MPCSSSCGRGSTASTSTSARTRSTHPSRSALAASWPVRSFTECSCSPAHLEPDAHLVRLHLDAPASVHLKAWAVTLKGRILHVLLIDKGKRGARVAAACTRDRAGPRRAAAGPVGQGDDRRDARRAATVPEWSLGRTAQSRARRARPSRLRAHGPGGERGAPQRPGRHGADRAQSWSSRTSASSPR